MNEMVLRRADRSPGMDYDGTRTFMIESLSQGANADDKVLAQVLLTSRGPDQVQLGSEHAASS